MKGCYRLWNLKILNFTCFLRVCFDLLCVTKWSRFFLQFHLTIPFDCLLEQPLWQFRKIDVKCNISLQSFFLDVTWCNLKSKRINLRSATFIFCLSVAERIRIVHLISLNHRKRIWSKHIYFNDIMAVKFERSSFDSY